MSKDLAELIERVKAAAGPDKALDDALRVHFGYPPKPWNYTASIEATLALVERCLPDHYWSLTDQKVVRPMAVVAPKHGPSGEPHFARTAPLAITLALLTALQSQGAS